MALTIGEQRRFDALDAQLRADAQRQRSRRRRALAVCGVGFLLLLAVGASVAVAAAGALIMIGGAAVAAGTLRGVPGRLLRQMAPAPVGSRSSEVVPASFTRWVWL